MDDDERPRARFMLHGDAWGESSNLRSTFGTVMMLCAGVVIVAGLANRDILAFAVVAALAFAGVGWWQLAKGQQMGQHEPDEQLLVLETGLTGVRLPGSTERVPWDWVHDVTVHRGFGPHLRLRVLPPTPMGDDLRSRARTRPAQITLAPEHFGVGMEELISAFAPFVPIDDPDGPYGPRL